MAFPKTVSMKVSVLCAGLFAALGLAQEEAAPVELVVDPNFVPTPEKPFNIHIDSVIKFKEDGLDIGDIYNGETIELLYNMTSFEPELLTVVGVGGELIDPVSGYVAANITAAKIGPVEIPNNTPTAFSQKVGIQLSPGAYVLSPAVYVRYDDQFMMLTAATKLVNIKDAKVSLFNPKLIFAELVLGSTVAFVLYSIFQAYGAHYLAGVIPNSMLPADKKAAKKAAKVSSSAASESSASDVEQWLPDTHKRISKRSNRKKA